MRALLLSGAPGIPLLGPSGASAHLRGVARALDGLGWDVEIAVPRREDARGAVEDDLALPVTVVAPRRWGWLPRSLRERGETWDGRRLAAATGPCDLVWERHGLFCDGGLRLARRRRIPLLLEVNAPLALERARYETLRDAAYARRMEARVLRGADRVITVSRWLAEWAVAEIGCAPERVRHVPNGVEDQGAGDRAGTRRRLGLEGPVLGFLGTMKPWHGLERVPGLLDALPEATALVVGDGPVAVPHHPRIRAMGRVPPRAVPDLVAAMDVGLAPYADDAPPWFCPLKVLAYRAQGVPVVASDVGDCRRLLADGSGVIAEDDWGEAVRTALSLPRVRRLRSWRQVAEEALEGLEGLEGLGGLPA